MKYILALDQGTTSSRAIVFNQDGAAVSVAQREIRQFYPKPGWVEHDPKEIFDSQRDVAREALERADIGSSEIVAAGITNQRETTILWDRQSGEPLHNAIVWQDRRTAAKCAELRESGVENLIKNKTGLVLDPYFSGTKIAWMLDNIPGARAKAERGELAFGTVDTWLAWNFSQSRLHVTDPSNASRTMLFDIHRGDWDEELLQILRVPRAILPDVLASSGAFGMIAPEMLGEAVTIAGIAGDQQAALFGQGCHKAGMGKNTYGTGCFMLMHTGDRAVASGNGLLTTSCAQMGRSRDARDVEREYALEGSVFVGGAVVQWLRDELRFFKSSAEIESLAASVPDNGGVYLVPAFTGLGAPYWRPDCRGAIYGLTRNSGPAELARAALESVGFQTRDLLEAMRADWGAAADGILRVDGGMTASDWAMQFLSDILGAPVDRPVVTETTALGAAFLAGMQAEICPGPEEFAKNWALERRFTPDMAQDLRASKYSRWGRAVAATMTV